MLMYQSIGKGLILEYLTVMLCDSTDFQDDSDDDLESSGDSQSDDKEVEKSFYYEQSKKLIPSYIQKLSSTYFKTVTGDNKKYIRQKKRKRLRKRLKKKEQMFKSFCVMSLSEPIGGETCTFILRRAWTRSITLGRI